MEQVNHLMETALVSLPLLSPLVLKGVTVGNEIHVAQPQAIPVACRIILHLHSGVIAQGLGISHSGETL